METFYCVRCGIRVSGLDFRGDRSLCPGCLGVSPPPARETTQKIRRPSSGSIVAVARRPRTTEIVLPRKSGALLVGGLSLAGAALVALAPLVPAKKPERGTTVVVVAPPRETPPPLPAPSPPKAEVPTPPPPPPDPALEALAREIEEAASVLADEGRFEDALARIRAFPEKGSPAWSRLDGLRRQIEARARAR